MPRNTALPAAILALLLLAPLEAARAQGSGESPLAIVLTGTLQVDGNDLALILDTVRKKERVYAVNDCVPRQGANKRGQCDAGQGRLVRVLAESIVVQVGGKQHVVKMGKGITQAKPEPPKEPVAKRSPRQRSPRPAAPRSANAAPSNGEDEQAEDEALQEEEPVEEEPPPEEEDAAEEEAPEEAPLVGTPMRRN